MNQDLKPRWTAALRSGLFAQGQGSLNRDGKFCCIGVLGETMGLEKTEVPRTRFDSDSRYSYGGVLYTGMLATKDLKDAGLDSDTAWELAMMNDDGETFDQIADYIEEHL